MKRRRKVALSAAILIWAILLSFTIYYLYGFYSALSQPIPTSDVYDQKKVSTDGSKISMSEGDVISFESNELDYSVKVYGIETSMAKFVVNNFLYFEMAVGREKKIDLDMDNYYDILIRLHSVQGDEVAVSLRSIQEQRSLGRGIGDAVDRLSTDSGSQSKMIVLVLLVFALILLAYVTKEYIIPTINDRRKMSRKSEIETFNDLRYKFEEYKESGDTEKAKKVYDKARHLHRYMDDEDQQKTKKAVTEMAKYLK